MKRPTINTYQPFFNDNYALMKNMLEMARTQDLSSVQGQFTATLIYVNAIDSIATHIVNNLSKMVFLITQYETGSILFREFKESKGANLGNHIENLEKYEFPNKGDFIEELNSFNALRKKIVHNLLSRPSEELMSNIDRELQELRETAERIFSLSDLLAQGLTNTWVSYVMKISQGETPDPNVKVPEDLKSKLDSESKKNQSAD